jgi:hypothetical protein
MRDITARPSASISDENASLRSRPQLPPGKEKDDLLRRARLADMASHRDDRATPRLAATEVKAPPTA